MDLGVDIAAALRACDGLGGAQLRTFIEAFEQLNGPYAAEVLCRARTAMGLPWPT